MKQFIIHNRSQYFVAAQPSADPQVTQESISTQITPDETLEDDGPILPAASGRAPSQRQIEQDVATINPSIDSMESRG